MKVSLRSCRDFARECFSFGNEALNASWEAVRRLVKSRVEFPAAQIRRVFLNYVFSSHANSFWLRVLKRQSNVNRWGKGLFSYTDLQNRNCEEMHRGSFGFSVWFLSASSSRGSQWCNVLFYPYFLEAWHRYFVFL